MNTTSQIKELDLMLEPHQFAALHPLIERFKDEATEQAPCAIFSQVSLVCTETPGIINAAELRCWYLPTEATLVINQALESIKHLIAPVYEHETQA